MKTHTNVKTMRLLRYQGGQRFAPEACLRLGCALNKKRGVKRSDYNQ